MLAEPVRNDDVQKSQPQVVTVPLRRRTRAVLAAEIGQHGPIGFVLVLSGIEMLQEGPHGWELLLAMVSLVAGGALLVAMGREVRALRRKTPLHEHFPWVDLLSAPVVALEGVHKHHQGLHYIPYCYFAIGLLLLLKALLHSRLRKLRRVRLTPAGLEWKRLPWTRQYWRWSDVAAVEEDPKGLKLVLGGSSSQILALMRFENAQEARDAILEGFQRWGGPPEATEPAEAGVNPPPEPAQETG